MKKLIAVLMMVFLVGIAGAAMAAPLEKIDLEATKLTDPDGKTILAKDLFGGKKTAITFATTACANCRDEIVYLVALQKDNPDLQLVACIVDMRADAARINGFLDELAFKGRVIVDPKYQFPSTLGVSMTPSLLVIDKDGKIQFRQVGFDAEAKEKIKKAVK